MYSIDTDDADLDPQESTDEPMIEPTESPSTEDLGKLLEEAGLSHEYDIWLEELKEARRGWYGRDNVELER